MVVSSADLTAAKKVGRKAARKAEKRVELKAASMAGLTAE